LKVFEVSDIDSKFFKQAEGKAKIANSTGLPQLLMMKLLHNNM
jgi:hypothetical protein